MIYMYIITDNTILMEKYKGADDTTGWYYYATKCKAWKNTLTENKWAFSIFVSLKVENDHWMGNQRYVN